MNTSVVNQERCPNSYRSANLIVELLSDDIGYSLLSNSHFRKNEALFECSIPYSELRRFPDMHTIQISKEWHWCTKKQPIQFTQHSCFNINCKFVLEERISWEEELTNGVGSTKKQNRPSDNIFATFKLVALEDIKPRTVITVNYNSFEWAMSCSFVDTEARSVPINKEHVENSTGENSLTTSKKGREVRGFKYALTDEQKFLMDKGLLFRHIEDAFVSEKIISFFVH